MYGRSLAYVSVDGLDVNALMVERGYACVLYIPPDGDDRADEFKISRPKRRPPTAGCGARALRSRVTELKPYLVVSLALAVTAGTAHAVPYETFIDVDDEDDLHDLLAAQEITQDTFDELIDLLDSRRRSRPRIASELYTLPNLTYDDVDAIIAYRDEQNGIIKDPADLVTAGALTQEKLLVDLGVPRPARPEREPARGAWLPSSPRPATRSATTRHRRGALRGRFTALKHLTVGFAATGTRLRIGDPSYDPNRNALIADGASEQVHMPEGFVKWEDDQVTAIVGSYRAGFGAAAHVRQLAALHAERPLPRRPAVLLGGPRARVREFSGELGTSPCDWRGRLALHHAGLRAGAMACSVSASARSTSTSARAGCRSTPGRRRPGARSTSTSWSIARTVPIRTTTPIRRARAPTCTSARTAASLTPTSQFGYETLPNVFGEKLVGGNVSYFADRRSSIGVTAYGATETNLVRGIDLDFQEWSRLPTGKNVPGRRRQLRVRARLARRIRRGRGLAR